MTTLIKWNQNNLKRGCDSVVKLVSSSLLKVVGLIPAHTVHLEDTEHKIAHTVDEWYKRELSGLKDHNRVIKYSSFQ